MGVSISDRVEPVAGLVFAETRAFKEFIDETCVGVGAVIL